MTSTTAWRSLFSLLAVGTFAACSSSSAGAAATDDDSGAREDSASKVDGSVAPDAASTPDASCVHGGGNLCKSGTSCTTAPNGGCLVTVAAGEGTMPAFKGGTITDGTYYLTSATSYDSGAGDVGQALRISMTFTLDKFTLVQDSDAECTSAPTGSGGFKTSGTKLTLTLDCPAAATESAEYTATPTMFSYSSTTAGGSGPVFTFTRQ